VCLIHHYFTFSFQIHWCLCILVEAKKANSLVNFCLQWVWARGLASYIIVLLYLTNAAKPARPYNVPPDKVQRLYGEYMCICTLVLLWWLFHRWQVWCASFRRCWLSLLCSWQISDSRMNSYKIWSVCPSLDCQELNVICVYVAKIIHVNAILCHFLHFIAMYMNLTMQLILIFKWFC